MRHRNKRQRHTVPTEPYKAYAAVVTNLAAAVGVQLTDGTAELVVAAVALAVNAFAVWRVPNPVKDPGMPGEFLQGPGA
jgi:hypothetical protein